jgi:hypothetical protein
MNYLKKTPFLKYYFTQPLLEIDVEFSLDGLRSGSIQKLGKRDCQCRSA